MNDKLDHSSSDALRRNLAAYIVVHNSTISPCDATAIHHLAQ